MRKRVLRTAVGRSTLRSVDSEWVGRVIEPRNHSSGGSRHCRESGRRYQSAVVAERRDSAGVGEHGTFIMGSCRNLGDPVGSVALNGMGKPVNNPRPMGAAPCAHGSEVQGAAAVPPSEGNEARREGRQEVGVLHSTVEAGEPTRGTPGREGSTGTRDRSRERWRRP